jgi:hypothetical protein
VNMSVFAFRLWPVVVVHRSSVLKEVGFDIRASP